jgi:hypothetical protein
MTEFTDVPPSAQVEESSHPPKPFLNVPVDIADRRDLNQTAKLVYGSLNRLHKINAKRGRDTFRVSQERIAQQIGRSTRTVKRAIRELRGKPDAQGVPQFDPLIVVISTGHCNYYRLLPLQDVKKRNVDNLPDSVQTPEVRGDKSVTRIEGLGRGSTDTHSNRLYAWENLGYQLLDSEEGKRLIHRLILLCFDWNVENPELTPIHQRNRQRRNRRDVALFAANHGLEGLKFVIERCERTSLDDGAAVLRRMITGGLFDSEVKKIDRLYGDAA